MDGHKLDNIPKKKQSLIWETTKRVFLLLASLLVDQMKAGQVEERALLKRAGSPDNFNAVSVPQSVNRFLQVLCAR